MLSHKQGFMVAHGLHLGGWTSTVKGILFAISLTHLGFIAHFLRVDRLSAKPKNFVQCLFSIAVYP